LEICGTQVDDPQGVATLHKPQSASATQELPLTCTLYGVSVTYGALVVVIA
jgi:hypothetical protein